MKPYISFREESQDIQIKIVNGNDIRTNIEVDFIGGGHSLAYPNLIPKNEIWIEELESKEDMRSILAHEIVEYELMRNGKSYEEAHNIANKLEEIIRKI